MPFNNMCCSLPLSPVRSRCRGKVVLFFVLCFLFFFLLFIGFKKWGNSTEMQQNREGRGAPWRESGRKKWMRELQMNEEERRDGGKQAASWVNPIQWAHFQLACSLTPHLYSLFNYFLQGDVLSVTIRSAKFLWSCGGHLNTCTALHCSLQQCTVCWFPGASAGCCVDMMNNHWSWHTNPIIWSCIYIMLIISAL